MFAEIAFAAGMAKAAKLTAEHISRRLATHGQAVRNRAVRAGAEAGNRTFRRWQRAEVAGLVGSTVGFGAAGAAAAYSKKETKKGKKLTRRQRLRNARAGAIIGSMNGAAIGLNTAILARGIGTDRALAARARASMAARDHGDTRGARYGQSMRRALNKELSRTPKPVFHTPEHFWTQVPEHVRGKTKALAHHIWRTEGEVSRHMAERSLKSLASEHGFDAQRIIAYHASLPHPHRPGRKMSQDPFVRRTQEIDARSGSPDGHFYWHDREHG